MTEPGGTGRASDDDRDWAAGVLADAVATGRLTLAEHQHRLDTLYAAATPGAVAAVVGDLPSSPARRGALYRATGPYRCVVAGGRVRRAGRYRVGRFCDLIAVCGTLELDLRDAQPAENEVTLTVWGLAARIVVTVPPSWRLSDEVLVAGPRRAVDGRAGSPAAPLLRLRGTALASSFHLLQG
jgi:uncharacterized protein DUF1707